MSKDKYTTRPFDKIAEGLEEAIEHAKGKPTGAKLHTPAKKPGDKFSNLPNALDRFEQIHREKVAKRLQTYRAPYKDDTKD